MTIKTNPPEEMDNRFPRDLTSPRPYQMHGIAKSKTVESTTQKPVGREPNEPTKKTNENSDSD